MRSDESPPPALVPPGPKLTLKPRRPDVPPPVERFREEVLSSKASRRKKRKKKTVRPGSAFLQSLGAFLLIGAVLGGLFYHAWTGQEVLAEEQVLAARIFLVAALYLVLLMEAFTQNALHGIFSVFFPPYALIYGLFFSDGGPLRGMSLALLLFLGAEGVLTPENAIVFQARDQISSLVEAGQRLIQGDPRHVPGE